MKFSTNIIRKILVAWRQRHCPHTHLVGGDMVIWHYIGKGNKWGECVGCGKVFGTPPKP